METFDFRPGDITKVRSMEVKPPFLMSAPIPVHFQGWESSTYVLQRAGWEWRIMKDPASFAYKFIVHNGHLQLGAWSDNYDERNIMSHSYSGIGSHWKDLPPIVFRQIFAIKEARIVLHGPSDQPFMGAIDVDMSPSYVEKPLDRLFPFNLKEEPPEVIIEEADMDVVDQLERILNKQRPVQEEIRKKRRKKVGDVEIEDFRSRFKIVT